MQSQKKERDDKMFSITVTKRYEKLSITTIDHQNYLVHTINTDGYAFTYSPHKVDCVETLSKKEVFKKDYFSLLHMYMRDLKYNKITGKIKIENEHILIYFVGIENKLDPKSFVDVKIKFKPEDITHITEPLQNLINFLLKNLKREN